MFIYALIFTAGIAALLYAPALPVLPWVGLFPALLPLLYFRRSRWLILFLLGIVWAGFNASHALSSRLPDTQAGQELTLSGHIISLPQRGNRSIRFLFQPDDDSYPRLIRLAWYAPFPDVPLASGQQWQLTMRLKPPRGMVNTHSFDYEKWLFQQGVGATGYVRQSPAPKRISIAPALHINTLRSRLQHTINTVLADSPQRGLVQGLAIGIRDNISPTQWDTLRRTGTSHLLAISGLHIGLVAAIGFIICRWLWSRRALNLLRFPASHAGAIGSLCFALLYAALAGFSIPSQRALIMVSAVAIAILLRHRFTARDVFAISLTAVLIYAPFAVLSAGFWLSFSAVAIILYSLRHRYPRRRKQWLSIHPIIALGLTPLLLLFFGQTALISPLANLIAVPFVSLIIVPLILFAMLCLYLIPPLGAGLLQLADTLLGGLWWGLDWLAALPFASISLPPLSPFYWLITLASVLLLLAPRGVPARYLGIIGLLPLWLARPAAVPLNTFDFDLLDVGQGLAAVIHTQHHTLVFDTGAKFSERFNAGTAVVLPHLQAENIQHIDRLIISHADNDHGGGAVALGENIPILNSYRSPADPKSIDTCQAGQQWQWGGVSFEILHPATDTTGSENDLSCVLKVSTGTQSLLLTGDIEKEAEQQLIQRYGKQLAATILVAPHHGSRTSSSQDFIDAVSPHIVLFPTGYHNRWDFPADSIIARYDNGTRQLFNTATRGGIHFNISPEAISAPRFARLTQRTLWRAHNAAENQTDLTDPFPLK